MWFAQVFKMNGKNVDGILTEDDDLEGNDIGNFDSKKKAKDFISKYGHKLNVILLDDRGDKVELFSNADIRYKEGGEVEDRISQIDKEKLIILNEVDILIREHKKLYRNIDISMPKSDSEKQSDKKIANLLSRANELVMEKRNLIFKFNKMEQGGLIKEKWVYTIGGLGNL